MVSTRPFAKAWSACTFWRGRWRVENNGFREIKEGWHLEKPPWSRVHATVVGARITFTLIAFNVAQVAKSSRGRQLIARGIRRLRREIVGDNGQAPVIVFAGDAYGIFHIEELLAAVRLPPTFHLHRPSRPPPP